MAPLLEKRMQELEAASRKRDQRLAELEVGVRRSEERVASLEALVQLLRSQVQELEDGKVSGTCSEQPNGQHLGGLNGSSDSYARQEISNLLAMTANRQEIDQRLDATAHRQEGDLPRALKAERLETYQQLATSVVREEVGLRLATKVDRQEVNRLLGEKVNIGDTYTRQQIDQLFARAAVSQATAGDTHRQQIDQLLARAAASQARIGETYTRQQIDKLLAGRARIQDIVDYHDSLEPELWTPLTWMKRITCKNARITELTLPVEVPQDAKKLRVLIGMDCHKDVPIGWYSLNVWTYQTQRGTNKRRVVLMHSCQDRATVRSDVLEFAIGGDAGRTLHFCPTGDSEGCWVLVQIFGFRQ